MYKFVTIVTLFWYTENKSWDTFITALVMVTRSNVREKYITNLTPSNI
jgi:hypothetical protein